MRTQDLVAFVLFECNMMECTPEPGHNGLGRLGRVEYPLMEERKDLAMRDRSSFSLEFKALNYVEDLYSKYKLVQL